MKDTISTEDILNHMNVRQLKSLIYCILLENDMHLMEDDDYEYIQVYKGGDLLCSIDDSSCHGIKTSKKE